MLIKLLFEIIIGGFCGYVANKLMNGPTDSFLLNVILGVAGGFVGGLIGNLLGIGGGWVTGIILSIIGACVVVWAYRKFVK